MPEDLVISKVDFDVVNPFALPSMAPARVLVGPESMGDESVGRCILRLFGDLTPSKGLFSLPLLCSAGDFSGIVALPTGAFGFPNNAFKVLGRS